MFTYLKSLIQELRAMETAMKRNWRISVQEFVLFTLAAFLESAELCIECHETYDPEISAEQTDGRGLFLESPEEIQKPFTL